MRILRIICTILALGLTACSKPDYAPIPDLVIASLGTPEDNEIWFVTTDGKGLLALDNTAFNTPIKEIDTTEFGIAVIRFEEAVTTIGSNAFNNCRNILNLSLPNSVHTIGERAFYDCINMECLTLGNGLLKCENDAFGWCGNLHSLHIPNIYNWCLIDFENAMANPAYFSQTIIIEGNKIEKLNIPHGIERIHPFAFYNNTSLKSVTIPISLLAIGKDAFYGCDNISRVDIRDVSAWSRIDFEGEMSNPLSIAKVLYLGDKFVENVSLRAVERLSQYAFINCTTINTFTADNALKEIGTDALRNCSALTTVTLGSGVEKIEEQAFWNCEVLNRFVCNAPQPPTLDGNNTLGRNADDLVIEVPSASLDSYTSDAMWSKYKEIIISME